MSARHADRPLFPVFGSRATSSNLGWRLFLLGLMLFLAAELSFAEQLGAELLSITMATTTATPEPAASIDEIVVVGTRNDDGAALPRRLLDDPLLTRILHDFELRQELEEEFQWRLKSAYAAEQRPPYRLGHDPREDVRKPEKKQALALPMELIRPAIVISVDF